MLRTGNRLLDQFQPKYFGIAFPYVFKYCTGVPDPPAWSAKARFRRHPDAPRVELADWVKTMARRCEAHVARDRVFGFFAWNLHFRSALNLSRNVALFDVPVYDDSTDTWRRLKGEDIEAGAQELLAAVCAWPAPSRAEASQEHATHSAGIAGNTRSPQVDAFRKRRHADTLRRAALCHLFARRSTPTAVRPHGANSLQRSGARGGLGPRLERGGPRLPTCGQ